MTVDTIDLKNPTESIPEKIEKNVEYINQDFIRYQDYVYKKNIRTVLLHRDGFDLSSPLIALGTNNQLKLTFDDLDGNIKNYYYTIVQCNSDWTPNTQLIAYDYMEGFTENKIMQYEFSFNTFQKYTHYALKFPNENIKILKSGNYLLKVYLENNPDDVVITRRFYVGDFKAEVLGKVGYSSVVRYRNSHQKVDFTIQTQNFNVSNPFEDIKVVVTQNDRWDNAIKNLKPLFVRDNNLIYEYQTENLFPAGKEFRWFDFRSFRYRNERVEQMVNENPNQVYLVTDMVRSYKRSFTERDINGKFQIEVKEGRNSELESDYAYVHFVLPFSPPLTNGNLYVFGSLTDWNIQEDFKMKYDYQKQQYQVVGYLKQGFYNYEYVFVEDGKDEFDQSLIEGDYYETENNYSVYVYYRPFGSRYDELIAIQNFNSTQ